MFNYKTTTSSVITKISRKDNIFLFYNPLDLQSYIAALIIFRYFQNENQTDKIILVPSTNSSDLFIDRKAVWGKLSNSVLIFINSDITKALISNYIMFVKNIIVIDSYSSSYKGVKKAIEESIYSKVNKEKISFTYAPGACTPLAAWRLVTLDDVPNFIEVLQGLYVGERRNDPFNDYDLTVFTNTKSTFYDLQEYIESDSLEKSNSLKDLFIASSYAIRNAITTAYRDSFKINVKEYKAICINCSEEDNRAINFVCLQNPDFANSLLILFSRSLDGFKVFVKTADPKIDLLELFKKYYPVGNTDSIKFYCKDFFFKGIR